MTRRHTVIAIGAILVTILNHPISLRLGWIGNAIASTMQYAPQNIGGWIGFAMLCFLQGSIFQWLVKILDLHFTGDDGALTMPGALIFIAGMVAPIIQWVYYWHLYDGQFINP